MDEKIKEMKAYFLDLETIKAETRTHVRKTEKGVFGTSDIDIMKEFFEGLDCKDKVFLDLGSGDGRVVLLASLFCKKAIGIEFDAELIAESKKAAKVLDLGTDVVFEENDYLDIDFSQADILFMYMDQEFSPTLTEKLKAEFKGTLYSYESVYVPKELKKEGIIWVQQTPIRTYSMHKDDE